MSSVEFLPPTTITNHSKLSTNSYSNLPYLHGFNFCTNRFRVLQQNTNRFIPNSITFPSHNVIVLRNLGRFNLYGGGKLRFKESKILANCTDSGDSKATSSEKNESEGGQGVKQKQNPTNSGSSTNQRRAKSGKSGLWWSKGKKWQWQPIIQAQKIGVLLLQLGIFMFVMRLLRPGLPLPGSEPRTPTTFVSVPYSEFLSKISSNQVQKVEVDGVHIMFKLKNEGIVQESEIGGVSNSKFQESESLLRSVAPTKRIVYTTTRPSDIKTPYEKMLENDVEFGSPDKRSGGFLNSALVGLPGTGKTLLAKAVAGEAEVPFISCSASEFVELYVGMGASRVRDLFARAKKVAPSIVFIDEIDAVAKSRDGKFRIVSNDEREQTLNQLLTEMDGFDSNSAVIVLGATNRSDVLDPALRRPGRFDRVVMVETPDRIGREAILKVHVSKKELPLGEDVDLFDIASMTTGFTGADLANLVNEAALLAGRNNKVVVERIDFIQAVERSIAGIEKKTAKLKGSEKAVVARHEAGHAVVGTAVANLLPGQPCVEKLSILPRSGGALGFTYIPPTSEDRYLLFIDELRGRLVTLLGGRAAEEVVYSGRVSTGALDDIRRATDMAYKAVAEYGLNQTIGPLSLATLSGGGMDESGGGVPWGRDQGHLVDLVQREVKVLLQSALEVALSVVRANPTVLEGLGAHLEENEKVEGEELQEWLKLVVAPKELTIFIGGKQESLLPVQAGSG
ncbi:ATP-dependent zinc metalloprotease FTSH 7, chloroplastic-like isoform X3 [Durio zibethinus]|uniref:ATP-dependent zinc metalloprotease FTSH 7, chloroplastic-like isoform X3 n=1 Tax=Durio zibethinus TaxID=66656 RepID=A0A6P5ZTJ2_DURZI|nr:ATP-dependent zinc metalloprotease FTSH 7, chloroplastic-like isoform X3 [Durio zibethinus]